MALGLLIILGVILVAFYVLKKFGARLGLHGARKAGQISFQAQLQLGPKKSVVVVRFLNKILVLGVTEHNINLLTQMDDQDDNATQRDFSKDLEAADANGGPG